MQTKLSTEQYFDLRTEVETELRRLIPDAERLDERSLGGLAPRARGRAKQLVDILRRMDQETFGVCVSCQAPIAYERLAVIPETTICAQCSWGWELTPKG